MKFLALGGAREIGASCYLIEIDRKRILVDCGLRVLSEATMDSNPFPDLESAESVDAICVTHAHMDHIGALPLATKRFPKAPCFMTLPTFPLATIMLFDLVRRIEEDILVFHAPDWFTEESVEGLSRRVLGVKFHQTFRPFGAHPLSITFLSAGHILGAAGVHIKGEEGSVLFTGDFTLIPQRTVPGADFMGTIVDLLVTETTYGSREHSDREKAEERLCGVVADTVSRGGKVLIPTFALGRAQEVLLILQHAQAVGKIPAVPIFVDGMVRGICDLYETMIRPNLFFGEDTPAPIIRVIDAEKRLLAARSESCIIISSSGQMVGGPSVSYAETILPDPKSTLILVSYQDEESPGRRLLRMKTRGSIRLRDQTVKVNADVADVQLSAHADAGQLVQLAKNLNPRSIIGVHGEAAAAEAFAKRTIAAGYSGKIWIPENGEEVSPLATRAHATLEKK